MAEIALIGAGPIGSLLAAALLHNGVAFRWVVRSPERRAELQRGSLELQAGKQQLSLHLTGIDLPDFASELPVCNWYILAVKAQHVLPLIAELSPYPGANVLAVTNGLHDGPFHLGVLHGGAYLKGGTLVTGAANRLRVGPLGEIADASHELLNVLPAQWLEVDPVRDAADWMWRKAALNCVVNPLTALLDCDNGVLAPLVNSPLIQALLSELERVMHRATDGRLAPAPGELAAQLTELLAVTAANSSSMRQDLRRGRETEIEHLNLAAARIGRELGLDLPLNDGLGRMVQRIANSGAG